METSKILTGGAISRVLGALAGNGVVAGGWRGADPDPDLFSFHDAGPGPVTALLSYLMAVRTDAAARAGGFSSRARFYRDADPEFSLRLACAAPLGAPPAPPPAAPSSRRGVADRRPP